MKENMFDVLMYLFKNHMEGNAVIVARESTIMKELKEAGFDVTEISNALDWLDGLVQCTRIKYASPHSFRILAREEKQYISEECWGFISYLEQLNILDFLSREIVLDRLMDLHSDVVIDISHIKWVSLMVLFHLNDRSDALNALENLVLTAGSDQLH